MKLLSLIGRSLDAAQCCPSLRLFFAAPNLNEAMSYDGLQKVKVKDIDLAYVLPGASLGAYHSLILDPVYVAFAKNWQPTTPGGFPIEASDLAAIRSRMAKLVYDSFSKEMQRKGGFPVVTAPGPDVLLVKLNIINLIVTAPDTNSMGTSFVASPGQATLYAEFYDSQTGAIIARVLDQQAAQSAPGFSMMQQRHQQLRRPAGHRSMGERGSCVIVGTNKARSGCLAAEPAKGALTVACVPAGHVVG